MFLNILVAIDRLGTSALEQAADLARAMNSKVTLITVASPASNYAALAGVGGETMRDELDTWAGNVLKVAADAIPDDVIPRRVLRRGHGGREIVKELDAGGYDLVLLGSRGRGRAQEGFFGSVNGYLHFHSRVPVLAVP
jgi:nucleotide-binding universal stress UspA family protein